MNCAQGTGRELRPVLPVAARPGYRRYVGTLAARPALAEAACWLKGYPIPVEHPCGSGTVLRAEPPPGEPLLTGTYTPPGARF